MIVKCARKVTDLCVRKMAIEFNDREIYTYGFEMIISVIVNLFWVLVAGIIFHKVLFALAAFICFAMVRTQSGGYHADSYLKCNLQLFLVFLAIMLITKYFLITQLSEPFFILAYIYIPIFIWAFSPLENMQTPIEEEDDRRKIRVKALIRVLIWETVGIVGWVAGLKDVAVLIVATLGAVCILLAIEKERRKKNEEAY